MGGLIAPYVFCEHRGIIGHNVQSFKWLKPTQKKKIEDRGKAIMKIKKETAKSFMQYVAKKTDLPSTSQDPNHQAVDAPTLMVVDEKIKQTERHKA
ncbi:hypothetical protein TSUD_96080 [Trifolium subterraneum]|nr:hypothetical protein TSUD_96080 [Trifolium subterraneum]